nr:MAG TPA: hypothetical protein [Caudoviricetes sp.]
MSKIPRETLGFFMLVKQHNYARKIVICVYI